MSTHKVMYIIALICFILAAVNVMTSVNLVALGLAFWVATLLF
jgi:hypothetical protein